MCCSTSLGRPYHPDWLDKAGGKVLTVDYEGREGFRIPDLDDVDTLARHLHLIAQLGARYDGHPDLDHVDLGSVGWWGEWHMSGSKTAKMPTLETRKQIIDTYVNAFRKTPLLMLIGDRECLTYAVQHGAGWRADCLGDMGGFSKNWYHMRDAYPPLVRDAGIDEAWKTAPVAWETCWDMRHWVKEDWSLRFILNYALALHGSYINNKSAPLPRGRSHAAGDRAVPPPARLSVRAHGNETPEAGRRRDEADHRHQVAKRRLRPVLPTVPSRLQALERQGYSNVLPGTNTVNKWMPGSVALFTKEFFQQVPDLPPGEVVPVADKLALPKDMPKGQYDLAVGIVEENSMEPLVRLAIKGRTADGWYPLSKVTISE